MKLYDIDEELRDLLDEMEIDPETGEVLHNFDMAEFESLTNERDSKIEGIAIYIKELLAESEALKNEYKKLKSRSEIKANKAERLKDFLSNYMINTKMPRFETNRVALSFRKSEGVEVEHEDLIPKKFFKKKIDYTLDKLSIKAFLKNGKSVKGAKLIEKQNLQIK